MNCGRGSFHVSTTPGHDWPASRAFSGSSLVPQFPRHLHVSVRQAEVAEALAGIDPRLEAGRNERLLLFHRAVSARRVIGSSARTPRRDQRRDRRGADDADPAAGNAVFGNGLSNPAIFLETDISVFVLCGYHCDHDETERPHD